MGRDFVPKKVKTRESRVILPVVSGLFRGTKEWETNGTSHGTPPGGCSWRCHNDLAPMGLMDIASRIRPKSAVLSRRDRQQLRVAAMAIRRGRAFCHSDRSHSTRAWRLPRDRRVWKRRNPAQAA